MGHDLDNFMDMTQHLRNPPSDHFGSTPSHHDEAGLADMLDLDADVLGPYLAEVTEWAARHAPVAPATVIDVGAGTGTGSLALARQFGAAEIVAIDTSELMLERIRTAALDHGLADRLRVVQADVDVALPVVGAVDVAWAASSLHHLADPDRVLRDIHAALNPGGLLVVIEMDGLPRFLPDDLGVGEPGLEVRCHRALAELGWNAHPDWRPHLERAGFDIVEQRRFTIAATPVPPKTGRYARAFLSRVRSALDGRLATDDIDALDHLLMDGGPDALLRQRDLTMCGSRTAWAARRPSSRRAEE